MASAPIKPQSLPNLNGSSQYQQLGEQYAQQTEGVLFKSEAFRLRNEAKISELVRIATASSEACETNALLARKALKYRRVFERHPAVVTAVVPC